MAFMKLEFIIKLGTLIMTYVTVEGNNSKFSHIGFTILVKEKDFRNSLFHFKDFGQSSHNT